VGRAAVEATLRQRLAIWATHFLLVKLMFLSGWVKLASLDPLWLEDTALAVHYETQPLPTPLAWHAHQWPLWLHKLTCRLMFVVELAMPLLLYCGRWGRLLSFLGFAGLMIGVMATGNYTFFNWLTLGLALCLLDDSWWSRKWKARLLLPPPKELNADYGLERRDQTSRPWARALAKLAALPATLLFLLSLLTLLSKVGHPVANSATPPPWFNATQKVAATLDPCNWAVWLKQGFTTVERAVAPFQLVNSYGLFANMTAERNEIAVEVSADGQVWHEVPFRYKPTSEQSSLHWVAPFQPRLDWQFWFAAFSSEYDLQRDRGQPHMNWYGMFLQRLLENNELTWSLLGDPPIPINSVRSVRAVSYRYRFTTPAERKATGSYWHRQVQGRFTAAASLG
jgi:lipase maturation factor 1